MSNEYKIEGGGIGMKFQGFYKALVVNDSTNEVVSDTGWHKNLILNSGLDAVASQYTANLSAVAICGTGSRPNSITSSTSTITQSGGNVYLYETSGLPDFTSSYSTYSSSVQVGDVIKYANNSESKVTSIVDGFNLVVSSSYEIDAANSQSFTIWKTSQTDLEGESKRHSSYLTGVGNCGTTTSASTYIHRRSYDFATETVSQSYTEVGISWTGVKSVGSTFGRVLLPTTMSVGVGFKLRVVYDLFVYWGPSSPRYFTASISGWPVAPSTTTIATESIQNFLAPTVDTNGSAAGYLSLEPSATRDLISALFGQGLVAWFSTTATPLAAFGSANNRTPTGVNSANGSILSYVGGSYTIYKVHSFDLNTGNSAALRSFGYGNLNGGLSYLPYNNPNQAVCVVFDQPQTKLNTQTMTLTWKYTWGRIL